ncbi:Glu/Leu/Phe/Val dehydrogenase dimerization domain-containing protein [Mastigocoleus sp. MO_188.B34]|uniref:Glu/Leu/Phe/Val dehydrogenase dimerization domain-containing protein n=1 Tax=Mastigocoleus sp. MO_188.B34 TaxID=3036635 RepID=UPI00262D4B7D|nr:Glu/Leu/Phe/Val dehydrogenase dimerization domain-containing protein [Mastigocoleus sp. MO_188.B34]MDJ0694900.1 Glu/Leu/Phe/Val dehydrogenase dimerization domain-containing protein [Mastigocoleus sp. MO_188.B34]
MQVFKLIETMGHEQVSFCHDKKSGLKAIIAIHNTNLGPAMGGTRLFPYGSEEEALKDVLRLSQAMTYKAACANIPAGGGKGVIIADPKHKTQELFAAYGDFVETFKGRFITGEDLNISVENVRQIFEKTLYLVGLQERYGGAGRATAIGTVCGMKAAMNFYFGKKNLHGLKVAVQGIGKVGKNLCQILSEQGVEVFASDPITARVQEVHRLYQVHIVDVGEIYDLDVDIFAPCALGGIINSWKIPRLKVAIIAGSANNQLENEEIHSRMLAEHKIIYCPDYVINAGGLINVYDEMMGIDQNISLAKVRKIADTLLEVFKIAEDNNITTLQASKRLAEQRFLKDGCDRPLVNQ